MEILAYNLRKLRKIKNKTQAEISHEIGISERSYQRLENMELKNIKISTFIKILQYYDIDFEDLFK